MILSMTGYGKATADFLDKKINVEIKSLNSKALDLSMRVAPSYREKEMEMRKEINAAVERGKTDFILWIEKKDTAADATRINQNLVAEYYRQIKEISSELHIPVPEDWFQTLLKMPDVLSANEISELSDEEWDITHKAIAEAIERLIDFRKQEGAALEKKLREKITNITNLLASIEPYEKDRVEKIKGRIQESLKKYLDVEYDQNRFEQELIYYIEKLD